MHFGINKFLFLNLIIFIHTDDHVCNFSIAEDSANVGVEVGNVREQFPNRISDTDKSLVLFQWADWCDICRYFDVNSDGTIQIIHKLDRESGLLREYCAKNEICKLSLHLIIYEGKVLHKNTIDTCLYLVDVNDNFPAIDWNGEDRFLRITENQLPRNPLGQFSVTDEDAGKNGEVTCKVLTEDFALKQKLSKVQSYKKRKIYDFIFTGMRAFDYEKNQKIEVKIECSDHGSPSKTSTDLVTVNIDDENDCKPEFTKNHYTLSIPENKIMKIQNAVLATDRDLTFPNNHVTYYVERYSNLFRVSSNGTLEVLQELDYEYQQQYQFKIFAFDGGVMPNRYSSSAMITVVVVDENDNSPLFSSDHYYFKIREDHVIDSEIGRIQAKDEDSGQNGKISYFLRQKLFSENCSHYFKIEKESGVLILQKPLDAHEFSACDFSVLAKDGGTLKQFETLCKVTVEIEDINNHKPEIISPINKIIQLENITESQIVTRIVATDGDIGLNALLNYEIIQGRFRHYFTIDEVSGEIRLQKSTLPPENFQMTIRVSDNGVDKEQETFITLQIIVDNSKTQKSSIDSIFMWSLIPILGILILLGVLVCRRWAVRVSKAEDPDIGRQFLNGKQSVAR
ncbi:cadherin EGF LAG seven-pass G-type receptor 1-like [Octopus sinensis]|uniref:Cadherin EGF LAG seven-pass G-type receptor 1-like n=1 Tax=Octopus sinensis TaxID=2607531 RepID=A0A6P7U2E8_9MOLL|nr:cadherin EGF LAG seven-pass G-type receptor 1-like [Octopus sinensis]